MPPRSVLAPASALLLLCQGCSSPADDLRAAEQRWERLRPPAYAYTYRAAASSATQARVEVRGRTVTYRVTAGDGAGLTAQGVTVDAVFGYVREALRDADEVEVQYDAGLGYPRLLQVDEDERTADDEYGVRLSQFTVLR